MSDARIRMQPTFPLLYGLHRTVPLVPTQNDLSNIMIACKYFDFVVSRQVRLEATDEVLHPTRPRRVCAIAAGYETCLSDGHIVRVLDVIRKLALPSSVSRRRQGMKR